jgi:hypothetical protein
MFQVLSAGEIGQEGESPQFEKSAARIKKRSGSAPRALFGGLNREKKAETRR